MYYFASKLDNANFDESFENVPLFDQKSHFFKDFVPLFAFDRLVGMQTLQLTSLVALVRKVEQYHFILCQYLHLYLVYTVFSSNRAQKGEAMFVVNSTYILNYRLQISAITQVGPSVHIMFVNNTGLAKCRK